MTPVVPAALALGAVLRKASASPPRTDQRALRLTDSRIKTTKMSTSKPAKSRLAKRVKGEKEEAARH